MKSSYT